MKNTRNCLSCGYSKMSPTDVINASLEKAIKKFQCKKGIDVYSATMACMYCAKYEKKEIKHATSL